jgi:hypothetical protein
MAISALDQLRSLLKMWFYGPGGPQGTDPPPEPSMRALMNVCCGPRLLSKALKLHDEDQSAAPGNSQSAEGAKTRG